MARSFNALAIAMRYLAGATLSPDAFDAVRRLCSPNDPGFPCSYEAWLKLVDEANTLAVGQGLPSDPIVIDVPSFSLWCLKATIRPSLDGLRAYMLVQRQLHL